MEISEDPIYQLVRKLKNVKHELELWMKKENVLPKSRIHLQHEEELLKKMLNEAFAHEEGQYRPKAEIHGKL